MVSKNLAPKLVFLVVSAIGLAACGGNGASREVLVDTLENQAQLTSDQAECVAKEMYGNGDPELNEDFINSESSKSDEDRDERFDTLVTSALDTCGVGVASG